MGKEKAHRGPTRLSRDKSNEAAKQKGKTKVKA
jgi:hypothetical protein